MVLAQKTIQIIQYLNTSNNNLKFSFIYPSYHSYHQWEILFTVMIMISPMFYVLHIKNPNVENNAP